MTHAFTTSPEVRSELSRAFGELRPRLIEISDQNGRLYPDPRREDYSDEDIEQLLNAYEMIFRETVEERGREQRELIFDTALPPVLELQSALEMVRNSVSMSVLVTAQLLPLVREDLHEEAALWLAGFYADYTYELAERAQAIEAGGQA